MSVAKNELSLNTTNINGFVIDKNTYDLMTETLYPGVKDSSIVMLLKYCMARKLDPIKKFIHVVPMNVKTGKKNNFGKDIYEWRDTIMPGIGLYRVDADRTGEYAGMSEPTYGEDVTEQIGKIKLTYPKWCLITVYRRMKSGEIVGYPAKEYWKENYAQRSRDDITPNMIWEKRAYGQIAKCTEAQALRKGFPEAVGSEYTKEEMEGKIFENGNDTPTFPKKVDVAQIESIAPRSIIPPTINMSADAIPVSNIDEMLIDISQSANTDDLKNIYDNHRNTCRASRDTISLERLKKATINKKAILEREKFVKEMDEEDVELTENEEKDLMKLERLKGSLVS
jgi:phage recombination protein Bet